MPVVDVPAPVLTDDPMRLAALDGYAVLDTPPEEGFDDVALLASQMCRTPVALVSLVDRDRQWFKARVGFPRCETALNESVCAHALAQRTLLVIPDLSADPRTRDNPLVTGETHLRFYAGAPLVTADGHILGTLCVIDHAPRPSGLSPEQRSGLQALARQVMAQLDLRRAMAARDVLIAEQRAVLREREALVATQNAITSAAGDLAIILDRLVAGVMEAVPSAEGGAIEMLDGAALEYRAVRGTLSGRSGLRVPLDGSVAGASARSRTPIVVADVRVDPRVDQILAESLGLRAALCAPIIRGDAVLGVLKLQSSTPGAFTARDVQSARLFAGVASAGLTEVREAAAQRAVQASETRYKTIFDSAIDYAIIVMDLAGRITDWNEGAVKILGWSVEEAVGEPADLFFTPDDRAADIPEREMRRAVETGRGIDERWHIRKTGALFWANGEMMVLRDAAGQAIGYVKFLRDRTEERQSLERLQESERKFALERGLLQSVLQQAPVGISLAFADGRALFNARGQEMMGHRAGHDDARYAGFNAVHPDGRAYDFADFPTIRSLRQGETIDAEAMHYRNASTGEERRLELYSAPIHGEDGSIAAAVSVFVDVEDKLRAREALEASEAHWRGLFEQLREGFILGKVIRNSLGAIHDWRYLEVNRAWGELVGVDSATATGRTIREVFSGIEDAWVEEFASVVDTGQSVTFTRQVGVLDRWYEGRAHRLSADTFVVLFLEVTERVRSERVQQASEARKSALIELGDRLRDFGSVPAMTRAAAEIVGRALGVSRAGFGRLDATGEYLEVEPDWMAQGASSIAGRHRLETYGRIRDGLRRGEPLVITDVTTDPRTASNPVPLQTVGIAALINMPVRDRGRTVAVFIVHDDKPRAWTDEEIAFLATVADRLEVGVSRLRGEEQQRLLNHEVSHRLKNTLAMVQAIIAQTLRNASDLEGAKKTLSARVMALSTAHDLLMSGAGNRAALADIIRSTLDLHDDKQTGRFTVDGPDLRVDERASLSFALTIHELATNAVKYGALQLPGGGVSIAWTIGETAGVDTIRLVWREQGGPPVTPPTHKGFGSRLIERGLAGAVGGTVSVDYAPDGLVCILNAPLSGLRGNET